MPGSDTLPESHPGWMHDDSFLVRADAAKKSIKFFKSTAYRLFSGRRLGWPEGHAVSHAVALQALSALDGAQRLLFAMGTGMPPKPEIPPRQKPVPPESPPPHELNSVRQQGRRPA
jgi:hypothetical protein